MSAAVRAPEQIVAVRVRIPIDAFVIGEARGRVPVIAGTGSNSTREAVELTKLSHDAGADAMLVVAPYYNKPSQEGLFRHFSEIAEATDKPIVLYSIPGRCGIEIGVPVVQRLRAKYRHVAWVKEAGGSVDRACQTVADADHCMRPSRPSFESPFAKCGVTLASEASPSECANRLSGNTLGQTQLCRRNGNVDLALLDLQQHGVSQPDPFDRNSGRLGAHPRQEGCEQRHREIGRGEPKYALGRSGIEHVSR